MEAKKNCTKCKISKPLDDYHFSIRSTDGRRKVCKECRIKERKDRYDKLKAKLGYYVYHHLDPKTGEVFYVGSGCANRAYEFTVSRSEEWKRIAKEVGHFTVTIVDSHLTRRESLDKEQEWQLKLKPRANFRYAGKGIRWGKLNGKSRSVINCRGEVYETVTDAALEFRTTPSNISNACIKQIRCSRYSDGHPARWNYHEDLDASNEEVVYSVDEPAEV